ncbi:MAG: tyrosine-type recombinase/integrase, partial [Beijerinckiaceae bacterium]|nr:tyrosine-type recombinase/integrase [Beijerinckiaceae bacterium]
SCLWRLAYRFAGKQRTLAIGVYPRVGLADARKAREAAKDLLADARDPSAEKKQAKRATRIAGNSFEAIAREWLENERPKWKSNHYERLVRRLEQNVFLHMGKSSIDAIEPAELLDVLRKIEARGVSDIPGRVRQTCSQVFRYAVATGRAKRDPTFDLRGALKAPPRVKHRASIAADALPTFMTRLARYNGDERTRLGIDFILRTMVRTTEARFARWPEFEDLDGRSPLWRIPPGRMKIQREHLVPLAPQVVELLEQLRPLSGKSDLVFVAPTNAGVLSENTFLFALYNLGYHGKATVHGFRGTASTILNENEFEPDWIERQLAHVEKDKVRAAYNAAQWLKQRRQMLLWWSDYLDEAEAKGKMQRDVDELVG